MAQSKPVTTLHQRQNPATRAQSGSFKSFMQLRRKFELNELYGSTLLSKLTKTKWVAKRKPPLATDTRIAQVPTVRMNCAGNFNVRFSREFKFLVGAV